MEIMIEKEAEEMREVLQKWRRQLHEIPECGLDLPKTAEFVTFHLEQMGVAYQTFPEHSGIVAVLGKEGGKCIALRADMDALLIQEDNPVSYASKHKGCMHACGHDAHTAMLLGAAAILKKHEEEIPGRIKLIFQPAEEMPPGGAVVMCEDGVLENPKVDAVLGLHMNRMVDGAKNGDFVLKDGSFMAADDVIKLKIYGKGGHASEPQNCVDAILTACNCVAALQQIVSRSVNPNQAAVISITDFHAGTGTDNVMPEEVSIMGTIRNSDENTRQLVRKRFQEVIEGITKAMGAEYELELIPDYPVLSNDEKMTELVREAIRSLYGAGNIIEQSVCSMGGDDFAFFSREVPGCYFTLVADKPASDGKVYPAHHPRFDIDDSVLDRGTAVFVKSALAFLEETNR